MLDLTVEDRVRREHLIELRRRRKFDLALDARASDPDAPDPAEVCRKYDPPPGYDELAVRRCPGCGGKVFRWPCLVCQLRGHAVDATLGLNAEGTEP
jgi:hypothetical protein